MRLELIGVTDSATGHALAAHGALAGEAIRIVMQDGIAAVLAPISAQRSFNPFARRKEALEGLVSRQKMLEAAITAGPFLAAKPGSRIADEAAAAAMITTHREGLAEHLASHGPLVQFQITVSWNPQKALAALKDEPSIRAAAQTGSQAGSPKAAASALREAMAGQRRAHQARFMALLKAASRDLVELPVATENDILNVAALIARDGEKALDSAVEAIDAVMPEALQIAYRGPSPALSFAALIVEEADAGSLAEARQILEVTQDASVSVLRGAFHAVARRTHPDKGGAAESFRQVQSAYATLRAEAEARTKAGAANSNQRLVIRREGETPWVA
jgi:hypothetical protein